MTRVVVGDIEVVIKPGWAWIENGCVRRDQIPDLQAALVEVQNILRRQL